MKPLVSHVSYRIYRHDTCPSPTACTAVTRTCLCCSPAQFCSWTWPSRRRSWRCSTTTRTSTAATTRSHKWATTRPARWQSSRSRSTNILSLTATSRECACQWFNTPALSFCYAATLYISQCSFLRSLWRIQSTARIKDNLKVMHELVRVHVCVYSYHRWYGRRCSLFRRAKPRFRTDAEDEGWSFVFFSHLPLHKAVILHDKTDRQQPWWIPVKYARWNSVSHTSR